ncbi:MAG: transglycosylase SLT domain-containing protein [Methylotenera sp.]|uniref:transglycosylase SLT domain-containing protein n=2 Tax=Methylotenera sp. TaxID=2051956 RepID=UPI00272FAA2F|nr:transglycosylase SLT domain-containing protein [Methylotenera sp.]MDP1521922.1 transglycosylase SLT domain-containing protein [Methylotenera sp.]
MFQLNFSHAHQFLNITHRNFKNTTIKLLTTKLVATKPATKLILSGLLAIIGVTCNVALAETNVAGEEIIIYADDTFKPAPRDLGNYNPFDIKNPAENRLGDSFDRELKVDANNEPETTTISSEDLWQRIKNGYAMPDSTSSLVTRHEEWYSSRPDYIKRMVERSQRYLFHIVEEVEKRGMPTEIALLPMIESAFNPQAYSTSSASGIWQFIPSTGKHFGLKQNWWVDNRRNVTFATDAALEYLQKLYGMFGSWDLALAAYNAGEGTVGRAIERNRKLGLPTNYESLSLPTETKNYVPKLQAIKNLMTNPGDYGLKIQTIANTPYFTKVSAPAQIDSHLAAKFAEITDSEFLALNPSYNRPVITGSGDKHELLLPILSAQTFRNNLATYDKPLVSWQTYYAKRGERMDNIASKFGIQVEQLRNANNLPARDKFKNSSTILVPNGNRTNFNASKTTASNEISSTQTLESANDLNTKQSSANIDMADTEKLTASSTSDDPEGNKNEPVKQNSVTHKVKKGETMQVIAKRYDVSIKQIIASNSLKNNHVKAGQLLTILRDATDTSNTKKQIKENTAEKNMSGKKNNAKNSNEKARVGTKSSQSKSSASKSKVKATPSKPKRHN